MSFADVNGAHLYVESHGAGPPIVFIHGATLDHRMWQRQVDALAARHRCVTLDLRAYGQSAPPTGPFKHCEDVAALIDHLDLHDVLVVGHSIGALYGIELALSRPDRVTAYMSLCMSGLGVPPFPQAIQDMFVAIRKTARDNLDAARAIFAACGWFSSARQHPALVAELDTMLADYSGWYWTHDSPSQNLTPPAVERLAQLRMPVLVVDGALDLDYNHAVAAELVRGISGAQLLRIPDAGHMASMESPEIVTRAIAALR